MKAYPGYINTEIPWLDKIPNHWILLPNKAVFKERKEIVGSNHTQYNLLSLTLRGVIYRNLEGKKGKLPAEFNTYQLVYPGDFVFCFFDVDETPRTVGLSSLHGMITGAYTIFETQGVNNKFLFYYYLSLDNQKCLRAIYKGLRKTIPINVFLSLKTPVPPLGEQQQIARYLDWKTTNVNKFIKSKKMLIALLREQKQNIINEAVTKGINPDVNMKDSGVDWLGEIPEHWDVRKFSTLARIIRGASPRPSGDPKYFNGSFMSWVTVGEITKDNSPYLYATETCLTEDGVKKSQRINAGTLIYSNSGATLGVPKITKIDCCANDGVLAFTNLSNNILSIFGYYYLTSLTERIRKELRQGGTQPNLNTSIVKRFYCPLPSLKEQNLIVTYIEKEIALINKTISQAEKEIELIKEYQTRLISDVVTGKIDVSSVKVPDFEPIEADADVSDEGVTEELVMEDTEE